jgi:uncharacterized repeat protein (TIGR01451 family)
MTEGERAMKRVTLAAVLILAGVIGIGATPVTAQVASSLINVGEQLDPVGLPGWNVSSVSAATVNGRGGWAIHLATTNAGTTLSRIWGSMDGVATPSVLATEGLHAGFTQNAFETRVGVDDLGNTCYSASGTSATGTDSAWLNTNALAIQGQALPAGPLSSRFWTFASAPTMSASGTPFFVAGTAATSGGSATARGLFNGTGDALVYSGREYLNLPAPIDDAGTSPGFSYKVSDGAHQFIGDVILETSGTGVPSTQDTAVMLTGEGLLISGQLVQEGKLVPVAAGGNGTENWANFDYYGVNEMRDYLITGDTSAATTADEFVIKNGQIVLREGGTAGAFNVTADIEGADLNESGDWVVVWDVSTTVEALVFNGVVVLREGQAVDFDGDGLVDPTALITELAGPSITGENFGIGNRNASGNVSIYFLADVSLNGAAAVRGVYQLVLAAPAGTPDDLQLVVTDSPDPQTNVPGDVTYSVAVRNNGNTTKTGVVVTSNIDAALTFNAGASDAIAVHNLGVVTANLGTFGPYEVKSYKFVTSAAAAGSVTTTTSVTANEADPVPGNNTATNTTDVGKLTDLVITITDAPDPLTVPNGSIVYTVQVTNNGPSAATGVVATLNLDPTTVFSAGSSTPGVVHNSGVCTYSIGALAKDATVSFTVGVTTTTQGLLSANGSVTGVEPDPFLPNTDTETTLYQLTTDLSIAIADSPDPVSPPGGQITYAVKVRNAGPSGATNLTATLELDPTTSFVSASSPAVHDGSPMGGVVSVSYAALASAGTNGFTVVVDTHEAGRPVALGEVTGGGNETDPSLANNERPVATLVYTKTVGLPVGVFSTIAASSTSDVPGLPGAKFDSAGGFDRPYRSPDGKRWIISADTTLGTATDEIILTGTACGSSVAAQEGVTTLNLGDHVGVFDTELSINDAGQFAFATNTDAATTQDEVIVAWNGTQFVTIAREGELAGPTTFNYQGDNLHSPQIIANGQVWFITDTTNPDTNTDFFVLWKNGNAVLVQEGVTIPTGQAGGASALWQVFDTGDLSVDATGAHWALQGDTNDADTTVDDIFVYDNNVVVQENKVLPGTGFTEGVDSGDTVAYGRVMSNGDWIARGDNNDEQDWVLKDGGLLNYVDGPMFTGSVELFDDAPFAAGFFGFAGNNHGDTVVAGTTNASEDRSNAALVLNNELVVVREDDPVDLDGDGLFDDGVRVHTFGTDDVFLTDDMQLYFSCTLRADGGTADIGDAYLRVNLCNVSDVCGDLDHDGDVDASDYTLFRGAYAKGECQPGYLICADFDESGVVGIADYQAWLACYRNFVGNQTAQPPVTKPGVIKVPGKPATDLLDVVQGAMAN